MNPAGPAASFLADFHIHSRYSRATSRELTLENLHQAARRKGITVVGTGDFTHPGWAREIGDKLVPAEEGLFRLRGELARQADRLVPPSCAGEVRFLLTAEISSIYKKDGRVRKVHSLLFAPGLEEARAISARLERIGNLASDGRPILGLDARELLGIVLDLSPACFVIPAHIWTPWFSVLGSNSGFDSLEACYEDLTPEIFALETGLSSDPAMNWRLSALDRFALVSNSDAHSPEKLGREANRFCCGLSFPDLREALRAGRGKTFLGTVEFFPEQGKYHFDGHRKCACRLHPAESLRGKCLCPVCGRKLTVGVMHRVELLADRPEGARPAGALSYDRLISLAEVVGDVRGAGPETKGVRKTCRQLLEKLGPELAILTAMPLEEIRRAGGTLVAEGIRRVRAAEVILEEGYDGEFGVVRLFRPGEREEAVGQVALIAFPGDECDRMPASVPEAKTLIALLADDGEPLLPGGRAETSGREARPLAPAADFAVGEETSSHGEFSGLRADAAGGAVSAPSCAGSSLFCPVAAESVAAPPSRGESSCRCAAADGGGAASPPCAESSLLGAAAGESVASAHCGGGSSPTAAAGAWSAELWRTLNAEQREAVRSFGVPLLLIAGPGTGKTHTLTCRIACLVRERGVPADRVLALTFTLRAAREMEERLKSLLTPKKQEPVARVRTFHALGAELLREAGPARHIPEGFRILGEEDQTRLLRKSAPSLSRRDAGALLSRISLAKRHLLYPDDPGASPGDPAFLQAYREYQRVLKDYRCLDYDDLVALPVRELERDAGRREELRGRFDSVSVDEYQDLNEAQYRFLRLLVAPGHDLFAIGDPDQAIYGFRGGSSRYFLEFERDYPGSRTLRLVRNYRSTEPILRAAAGMLGAAVAGCDGPVCRSSSAARDSGTLGTGIEERGQRQGQPPHGDQTGGPGAGAPKRGLPALQAVAGAGPKVREVEFAGEKAEAIFIAQTIESLMGGTDSLSFYAGKVKEEDVRCSSFADIAVLYRLKALAPGLESALRRQGIPFQGASRADCWQGREGRTLAAVLHWLRDPEDRLSWELIEAHRGAESAGARQALVHFREQRLAQGCSLREWLLGLPELGCFPFRESPWKEMWEGLLRTAAAFGRDQWEAFLRTLTLSGSADFLDRGYERVTLTTLHAAKGLEFPVAFIAGCEDLLLPCAVGPEETDPQEERRLLYVGMTRACRLLFLTRARSRFLYGERRECGPSAFLRDIPAENLERVRPARPPRKKAQSEQPLLFKL